MTDFTYSGFVCVIHQNVVLSTVASCYFDKNSKITIHTNRKPSCKEKLCEYENLLCSLDSFVFLKITSNIELVDLGLRHHAYKGQTYERNEVE